MSPITQAHFDLNRQGMIPLPEDSPESYLARCSLPKDSLPLPKILSIYDLAPTWVDVEYANEGLMPWEAACTWYSDTVEELPVIQMRRVFQQKICYLGIYQKEDILAHEYVHAARYGLHSVAFEEIFAYYLSTSIFRRVVGPLFEKPWESSLLLLLLLVSPWTIWPVFLFLGYLGARLSYRWCQWLRCKKRLEALMGERMPLALMVRLTDEEIIRFSSATLAEIKEWIEEQKSFRWQLLKKSYLFSCTPN